MENAIFVGREFVQSSYSFRRCYTDCVAVQSSATASKKQTHMGVLRAVESDDDGDSETFLDHVSYVRREMRLNKMVVLVEAWA